ncbi:hypothetical protein DITRI_Ditri04bG0146500 [Diplodiscus trichospermus]
MATFNLIRVSSPAYSTGSPNQATSKRVGTHNGSFHCDEALGCFMIRLTDKFSNSEIVRTRDPKVLEGLDAVLDVGGVYDPSNDRQTSKICEQYTFVLQVGRLNLEWMDPDQSPEKENEAFHKQWL